jgi:hypothetical protein
MLPSVTPSYLPATHKNGVAAPVAAKPLAVAVKYESSSSTTVEISGGSLSLTHQRSVGVDAYLAVEPAVKPQNPFADTILRFIDIQLRRDQAEGASQEELQSRLQAGLDGFMEGYGQAYEQLTAGGLLSEEVLTEIEGTREQVLAGIQKLADELGVELVMDAGETQAPVVSAPAPAAPAPPVAPVAVNPGKQILSSVMRDVQIVEQYQKTTRKTQTYEHLGRAKPIAASQSYAYGVKENRDFSLKLRTADGDAVSIRLSAGQTGVSQFNYGGTSAQLDLYGEQQAGFAFSVEGELDEGELRALTDLLNQVANVSEQFFSGDLDRAFELASNMDFDSSEIATFDLALHMTRTETAAVSRVERPQWGAGAQQGSSLDAFAASVTQAGDFAERMGQPRSLVADLLDWVAQSRPWEPRSAFLSPAARAFL